MRFDNAEKRKDLPPWFLGALLKVVRSRLDSTATNPIHSIALNLKSGGDAAKSVYASTLQLLVPEISISFYADATW